MIPSDKLHNDKWIAIKMKAYLMSQTFVWQVIEALETLSKKDWVLIDHLKSWIKDGHSFLASELHSDKAAAPLSQRMH